MRPLGWAGEKSVPLAEGLTFQRRGNTLRESGTWEDSHSSVGGCDLWVQETQGQPPQASRQRQHGVSRKRLWVDLEGMKLCLPPGRLTGPAGRWGGSEVSMGA